MGGNVFFEILHDISDSLHHSLVLLLQFVGLLHGKKCVCVCMCVCVCVHVCVCVGGGGGGGGGSSIQL